MYPRSQRFDDAVRYGAAAQGATPITTIDAYRFGERVASDLPWVKPSKVSVDEGASTWRTCEITVADIDRNLVPRNPQSALAPYGTDLFIRTGFRFWDGSVEQVPMGVFRLLTGRPTNDGRISLLGWDYSRVVARARFEYPKVFAKGYSRAEAIGVLISERTTSAGPSGYGVLNSTGVSDNTLPLTIFEEGERYGDPWKACNDLADAAGWQVFFGPDGPYPSATLRTVPDLVLSERVWTFAPGPGSTLVKVTPEQDTTLGYNVYNVSGESADLAADNLAPVHASAEVTDPSSPIYPLTYGRVPVFFASSFLRTNAQAQQVADANLPLKAGGSQAITVEGFPHPAHEAGDDVRVVDDYFGIDSDWIISRFSIDLSLTENAEYVCRAKRIA